MSIDIKKFYLNSPMPRYEYMRLKLSDLPDNVICHYNLENIVTKDGYTYTEIRHGMNGLFAADILAHQLLEKRLNMEGYAQSELTPGFWTHQWRPVSFTFCVDDFGVKYVGTQQANNLISLLQGSYKISTNREGKRYLGLE